MNPHTPKMPLAKLPLSNELVLKISSYLSSQRDLNAFVRTCRQTYKLLNSQLYILNITHHSSSALLWAVYLSRVRTLIQLLRHGADTSTTLETSAPFSAKLEDCIEPSDTSLHIASKRGEIQIVQLLLDAKADPRAMNDEGWTPLAEAIAARQEGIARLIYGSIPDAKPGISITRNKHLTPLHLAAGADLPDLVRFFLGEGANIDVRDGCDRTPLHYALRFGCLETTRVLLDCGVDVEVQIQWRGTGRGLSSTLRQIGESHKDGRIKELFETIRKKDQEADEKRVMKVCYTQQEVEKEGIGGERVKEETVAKKWRLTKRLRRFLTCGEDSRK